MAASYKAMPALDVQGSGRAGLVSASESCATVRRGKLSAWECAKGAAHKARRMALSIPLWQLNEAGRGFRNRASCPGGF